MYLNQIARIGESHIACRQPVPPECSRKDALAYAKKLATDCVGHLDPEMEIPMNGASGYRINITKEKEVKSRAIAAHQSQMTNLIADDPKGFRFTLDALSPFIGDYEYFYGLQTALPLRAIDA